ncbi:MAG: hypothetical protein Q7U91_11245 [Sideroxyarcus sp.]|nr:hypothetical protein [Sideroxyarcus sp.]
MLSNDFQLQETQELETEIERHCVGLGLDCANEIEVRQFVQEMLQNMDQLKVAGRKGDSTARAKVELFGMTMLLHQANSKVYGAEYMKNINALLKREPAWVALAKAMWNELEKRNPETE